MAECRSPKPGDAGSSPARRACEGLWGKEDQTVAQLVERLVWDQEVGGSSPSSLNVAVAQGREHWPVKPGIWVRFPSATVGVVRSQ